MCAKCNYMGWDEGKDYEAGGFWSLELHLEAKDLDLWKSGQSLWLTC